MTRPLTYECNIHFRRRGRGSRRQLEAGQEAPRSIMEPGRVPRVARLMALALRFEDYLRAGQVVGYTELADLGHVTRPRISQIMNLLNLAPDIQEAILFLPGGDPLPARRRSSSCPARSTAAIRSICGNCNRSLRR